LDKAMQYFDTHAHIGLIDDDPIKQLLVTQEARQAGVSRIMSVCNSLIDFVQVYENLKTTPNVYFAVGVSPSEVQSPGKDWLTTVKQSAQLPRVVAIGETGLDYYRSAETAIDVQKRSFRAHIQMAKELEMPLQIHDRDAHEDVINILYSDGAPETVLFHSFSGDPSLACAYAHNGWFISFSGTITFKPNQDLRDALRFLWNSTPELILIETDAPFLTPMPYRGRVNTPAMIPYTLEYIADFLAVPTELLSRQIAMNQARLFGIDWRSH
jgi:TatD DNase family protein